MKLILIILYFYIFFCIKKNYTFFNFQQCNIDSYSKKNKIANEIDINNIISIINNKNFQIYYCKKCVATLPIAKKSNGIFAVFTEKERFFYSLIIKKSKKYLEFGIGGSTLLAYMSPNIKKIISIDSDINWINNIRKFKNLKNDEGKRIILEYIDVGKTSNWGNPANKKKKIFFELFQTNI